MKTNQSCIVAPSVLSADFSHLGDDVSSLAQSGAGWVHLDVMDGMFVPNITFGPKMIQDIRPCSPLLFDTHLMVQNPERYVSQFAKAGSDCITVHAEATIHLHRVLQAIKDTGKMAGVSIVPSTPVSQVSMILGDVDLVLVMSVDPGFGGQAFIPSSLAKIKELDRLRKEYGWSYKISVDGGINLATASEVIQAGADVLVVGSAYFSASDRTHFVKTLQGLKSS